MTMQTISSFYVTPSLYSDYYWYLKKDSDPEAEKEDFLKVLRKEHKEQTSSMRAGIEFEKIIKDVAEGKANTDRDDINEIANLVKGGFWQERSKKMMGDILLYGVADVITPYCIFDIKFTTSKYELGKYDYSIQHLLYMYCTGIPHFKYLIGNGENVFIEEHSWSDTSLETLKSRIFEMLSFIGGNKEFKEAFESNWKYKK